MQLFLPRWFFRCQGALRVKLRYSIKFINSFSLVNRSLYYIYLYFYQEYFDFKIKEHFYQKNFLLIRFFFLEKL